MAFNYNDPLIYQLHSGQEGDEYQPKSESYKIINNKILLNELPVRLDRITISGYSEIDEIENNEPLESDQFICNYTIGILTFNPSEEGETVIVNYTSRGVVSYPASRVWTKEQDGDVIETLGEVVDAGKEAIGVLDNVQEVVDEANEIIDNTVHMGEYSSITNYLPNNIVSYNGSSYMNIVASTNVLPTEVSNWKLVGSKGDQGIQGIQGLKGDKGDKPDHEWNDTEIRFQNPDGSWGSYVDLKGDQGIQGIQGIQGVQGLKGDKPDHEWDDTKLRFQNPDGSWGSYTDLKGEQGIQGVKGDKGDQGVQGIQGIQGVKGDKGDQGIQGIQGVKGDKGDKAVNWKGEYSGVTAYLVDDAVSLNGSSYICIQPSTGNDPTDDDYWDVLALKGVDGEGTVSSVTSANSDISITNTTTTPTLTLNSSTSATANKIAKYDATGQLKSSTPTESDDVARKAETDALDTRLDNVEAKLLTNSILQTLLKRGWNYLLTDQASPLNMRIFGRTLVNLLGKDGNCESLTPFTTSGTVALSTTQKKSGTNSIKVTSSGTTSTVYKDFSYPLDTSNRYMVGCWIYIESYSDGTISVALADVGTSTVRYSANAVTGTVGSWQFVYFKIPASHTLEGTGFRLYFGTGSSPISVTYFDDIRLYEVSSTDYTAIGTTLTATSTPSIDDVFPYVDGVKHLNGVYVQKPGKNLLPPFSEWTLHANAEVVSPYELKLNATGAIQRSGVTVNVIPGQQYTMSYSGVANTNAYFIILNTNSSGSMIADGKNKTSVTFTAPSSGIIYVSTTNAISGTFTFTNPQLELGSVATAFEPQNSDYVFLPITLASNLDGSVRDEAYWRDGTWRKLPRWKTGVVLDGSLAWVFAQDYTGYKRISVPISPTFVANSDAYLIKHDGKRLRADNLYGSSDTYWLHSSGSIQLMVSDTDSGWTETLNPNGNSMKALTNGWKANGNNGSAYNSWISILDGSAPSSNIEAYVAANKSPNWTGWATLDYQLAASAVEEEVIVGAEGAISLHSGGNQFEIGEGIVVREKVTPVYSASFGRYYINIRNDAVPQVPNGSQLNYRTRNIIKVYRGDVGDNKWEKVSSENSYGLQYVMILPTNFDPTAEYFVTYVKQDKYLSTTNVVEAEGEYSGTLGTTVSRNVQNITDLQTKSSVHDFALDYVEAKADNNAIDIADHEKDYVRQPGYAADTGTANAKVVTLDPVPTALVDGFAVSFKNAVQNTGASTININGLGAKSILKANGGAVLSGNLKASSIYTVRYNGTAFILQGEGGEYGTAGSPQVLDGYTVGTDSGIIDGSMPNRGAVNITPGQSAQAIAAGYHNGSGSVAAVSFDATKVLTGTTIAGKGGTMPSNASPTATITTQGGTKVIPAGYTPGGTVTASFANLIADNVRDGVNIGNVTGNVKISEKRSGTAVATAAGTTRKFYYRDASGNDLSVFLPYVEVTFSSPLNGVPIYANIKRGTGTSATQVIINPYNFGALFMHCIATKGDAYNSSIVYMSLPIDNGENAVVTASKMILPVYDTNDASQTFNYVAVYWSA